MPLPFVNNVIQSCVNNNRNIGKSARQNINCVIKENFFLVLFSCIVIEFNPLFNLFRVALNYRAKGTTLVFIVLLINFSCFIYEIFLKSFWSFIATHLSHG